MQALHRAAGLTLAADRALPWVPPAAALSRADLRVHLDASPAWASDAATVVHESPDRTQGGRPLVTVFRSPDGFRFVYADGSRFWLAASGDAIWCAPPDHASLADTCTYLTGPVLAFALRLRGVLALHASAVAIDGRAIGFAGPHGAGKSTVAAACAARGCPVVTDDLLHVRYEAGRWLAEPFGGMLRLWPDAGALVFKDDRDLPAITPGWDKRALRTGAEIPAVEGAIELGAIAVLAVPECPGSEPAIAPLPPPHALVRLAANSSSAHLLDGPMRAAEFRALAALVGVVPCARVTRRPEPGHFDAFVDSVIEWARRATGPR